MRRIAAFTLLGLALGGCMLGPDYRRPSVDAPPTWRFEEKEAREIIDTLWWQQFEDPVLNRLIEIALKENLDIKIAASRLAELQGRYEVARAALWPTVGAGASAERRRNTERGQVPLPSTVENPVELYQGSIFANWEIDLWGKLRRGTEAARADLLSTEEGRRGVILSLVSSVASAYINLRSLDRQLWIARDTAMSRVESYRIFSLRFNEGFVSQLELSQVKSEYERGLAAIPALEKGIAQQENALSILIGRNPGAITRGKTLDELGLPAVPAGLPSDLLARRPDIRQAEQDLISANAQIGIARARYFPTISLTGMFGWESTSLSQLFRGPSRMWNWAIPMTQPIFTGGSIAGEIKAVEAFRDEALLRYQKAIQGAFRDVEDSLVDQRRTREQLGLQKRQVESLREYARTARLTYDNGYTSYIAVLDADRSLFDAQLAYSQTQGALFQALINLYKAMGGGWVVEVEKMAASPGQGAVLIESAK
ncbi:MAG: efflux transporter outer membrane subunit [Deltaproteobacteria bacterium]|nr:efflux transporter outer membrane subunit [Deltaproteobacteria bacterium]